MRRSIITVFQGKGTAITKMPCLSYLRKKKKKARVSDTW